MKKCCLKIQNPKQKLCKCSGMLTCSCDGYSVCCPYVLPIEVRGRATVVQDRLEMSWKSFFMSSRQWNFPLDTVLVCFLPMWLKTKHSNRQLGKGRVYVNLHFQVTRKCKRGGRVKQVLNNKEHCSLAPSGACSASWLIQHSPPAQGWCHPQGAVPFCINQNNRSQPQPQSYLIQGVLQLKSCLPGWLLQVASSCQ